MTIQSFKIAEHPDVMLPIMVNIDGFQLTHMIEPLELPTQKEVDKFLPDRVPYATLHPDKPLSMGCFNMPEIFTETMKAKDTALINSKKTIIKIWNEWEKQFGRAYKPVETYKTKGAETLILTMGSMGETASVAVDEMRKAGKPVGLVKLRLWRPFPTEELRAAIKGCKTLVVMDRAVSFGGAGGPVATEIKSLLFHDKSRPRIVNFLMGLGGRDMKVEDFTAMVGQAGKKKDETYEFYGVRE
jgi:pyruvate ferredoxin oxidoreductase alpha subunit